MKKTMTKHLLMSVLLIFAGIVLFSSCGKSEKNLYGEWKLTAVSDNVGGQMVDAYDFELNEVWKFTEDGKYYLNDEFMANFTFADDVITFDYDGLRETAKVQKLTSSKMQLLLYEMIILDFERK